MNALPKLITFDGEARSGKGTIAHATRDYLRDELSRKVMLIDAGQVFRSLVVAIDRAGVDVDDVESIDRFLGNDFHFTAAARFVKSVYHMTKEERNSLLYTAEVSADSAKVGARPAAQDFKDSLLRKWLSDARAEGYDTVLLDGRALEEVGSMMESDGLCEYMLGFYFICDARMGARRTLGYAETAYDDLAPNVQSEIDQFASDITERNRKDRERSVHPVVAPSGVEPWVLPSNPPNIADKPHPILIVDTSHDMSKDSMVRPVAKLVASVLV